MKAYSQARGYLKFTYTYTSLLAGIELAPSMTKNSAEIDPPAPHVSHPYALTYNVNKPVILKAGSIKAFFGTPLLKFNIFESCYRFFF